MRKLFIFVSALYLSVCVSGAHTIEPKKILIIPGGGALGVNSMLILAQLEKDTGKRVYELFDEIWGASIGALQAALLTTPVVHEQEPMTALEIARFLEEDVFAHCLTAFSIRTMVRKKLAKEPLLGETLIPIRILTSEVVAWKAGFWPKKTRLRGFSSTDDPHVFLSDVVCASATVFPLHPISEQISGVPFESAHHFIDAGCMASSSCCMDPYDFRHFPREKAHSYYFVGNGWSNRTFHEKHNYAVNVDLNKVFEQWANETHLGFLCQKFASELIKCNVGAGGFIPAHILKQASSAIAESQDYQRMLKSLL